VRDASLNCLRASEGTIVMLAHLQPQRDRRGRACQADRAGTDREAERNLADEIRILTDERLEAAGRVLGAKGGAQRPARTSAPTRSCFSKGPSQPRTPSADQHAHLKRFAMRTRTRGERADRRDRGADLAPDRRAAQDHHDKVGKMQKGDELSPASSDGEGYVAMKRKLSVGDKSGTDATRAVIARILPRGHAVPARWNAVEIVLTRWACPFANERGAILETTWAGRRTNLASRLPSRRRDAVGQRGAANSSRRRFCGHRGAHPALDLDERRPIRAAAGMSAQSGSPPRSSTERERRRSRRC